MNSGDSDKDKLNTEHSKNSTNVETAHDYFDSLILRAQNKLPILAVRPVSVFEKESFTDDSDIRYEEEYLESDDTFTQPPVSNAENFTSHIKSIQIEEQAQSKSPSSNLKQNDEPTQTTTMSMDRVLENNFLSKESSSIIHKHTGFDQPPKQASRSNLNERSVLPELNTEMSKKNAQGDQLRKMDHQNNSLHGSQYSIESELNNTSSVDSNISKKHEKLAEKVESMAKDMGLLQFTQNNKFRDFAYSQKEVSDNVKNKNYEPSAHHRNTSIDTQTHIGSRQTSKQSRFSTPQQPVQTRPIAPAKVAEKILTTNKNTTPTISVSVGHVEIKALKPQAAPVKTSVKSVAQAKMSLEKYLAKRGETN